MKVAFWSNLHGQNGNTSNMLAIGVMSVLSYNSKVILGQTHYNLNNLEGPLLSVSTRDRKSYFMDIGIDALVRTIRTKYLDEETIENCTLSYMNKNLTLLPGTVKNNYEIYEEDLNQTIISILQASNNYHDMVFCDIHTRDNKISKKIIEDVDLVVVNLSQNLAVINDYEENFLDKFKEKNVLYLFGNYNPDSRYSLSNLRKSYKWLKTSKLGVVPYNTEFMDSMSDGKLISFFFKNQNIDSHDPNSYFIKEVKRVTSIVEELRINKRW